MKFKIIFLLKVLILMVFVCGHIYSQDDYQKAKANLRKPVSPVKVELNRLPSPVLKEDMAELGKNKEYGPAGSVTIYDDYRLKGILPFKYGQIISKDPDTEQDFKPPVLFAKFSEQKRYNIGFEPGDPSIAAGKEHVVLLTNDGIYIYDKFTNNIIYNNTLSNFFGTTYFIFDPIIKYDDYNDRWLFTVVAKSDYQSSLYLAVSSNGNPMDDWYYYETDGTYNANIKTDFWADRPYLGVTATEGKIEKGAIVISMNQYDFSFFRPFFQYSKVRLFDKSIIYRGEDISGWWDFWDFQSVNFETVFNIAVANHLTPTENGDAYLLNTVSGGGSRVYLWKIENPLSENPEFKKINSVNVSDYRIPPKSPIYNQTDSLNIFDCRVLSVIYMNKNIYAGYNSAYNWGKGDNCVFRILRISADKGSLIYEKGFGAEGNWYMYPAIMPLYKEPFNGDTIAVGFIRCSSEIYPEARVVYFNGINTWSQSTLIMTGNKPDEIMFRLGDYNTVTADPYIQGNFWAAIGISSSELWGVAIGHFGFNPR